MIEGILPLWKEKGMTSFACVSKVRRIIGIKKVGHAGTLDPDVEGVLPIAVGKATKVLEFMLEGDKTYVGEVTLGYSTSTEDAAGEVIERKSVEENIADTLIDEVLKSFVGKIQQTPPMFSAVKINGKRLYEYAFEGKEVERPSREVEIYSLERTSEVQHNQVEKTVHFSFEVSCSKGTYIRTLAVDIGEKLNYPAHMSRLTRVNSGGITKEQTVTLNELEEAVSESKLENILLPIEHILTQFPQEEISEELWGRVKNGALLDDNELKGAEFPVLLTYKEKIVALYEEHTSKPNKLKPRKMFRTEL